MIAGIETSLPECLDMGTQVHMQVPEEVVGTALMKLSSNAIPGVEYRRRSLRFETF
jgi:hypothetical protein